MTRAVFDCMIFLQAVVNQNSKAGLCYQAVCEGLVELIISDETLSELIDVLNRPVIRNKFPELTDEHISDFIAEVERMARKANHVEEVYLLKRDVKDSPYINLAIATNARYIVSRDNDLLDLMASDNEDSAEFRMLFPHLLIIEPIEFLLSLDV
jgi:putative PIN family toxin of toxin-antitoxin system